MSFHWITEGLAVGDFEAAEPSDCWNWFDAILNVSEREHEGHEPPEDCYLWLPFTDGDGLGFEQNLDEALEFLEHNEGSNILVHCTEGISRSVSVVLAYLVEQEDRVSSETLVQHLRKIQSERSFAYPAQVFLEVIAERHGVSAPLLGW